MNQQFAYRLKVAQGFLQEVREDVTLKRWRSAMDNAQLAVENAAKSILALAGPVGRTHNPAPLLRQLVENSLLPQLPTDKVLRLVELAELLGPDVHIQTDYGDEMGGVTPWELFGAEDARQALAFAEEAVRLAQTIMDEVGK